MLTSVRMQRIRIIVLKRDALPVAEALGRLGVLELTRAEPEGGLEPGEPQADEKVRLCSELRRRLESLMDWLSVEPSVGRTQAHGKRPSLDEVARLVAALDQKTAHLGQQVDQLDARIRQAQDVMDQLAPYRELRIPPSRLARTSFLHVMTGSIPRWQIPDARGALPQDAVLVEIGVPRAAPEAPKVSLSGTLVLSSRRSRFAVRTVLEEHQFKEEELPADIDSAPAAIYEAARARRDSLRAQKDELSGQMLRMGESFRPELAAAHEAVCRELGLGEAQQKFRSTWATSIITGWTPQEGVPAIRREVERVTQGHAIFEAHDATAEDIEQGCVPSHAPQPKLLQPFQRLVHGFGQPGYREIEPTLMFAFSFLLMFGLIFGDLGHGLCLLGIGLLTRRLGRSDVAKDAGFVITAAGLASVLFGTFFSGAFFGHSLKDMGWPLTLGMEPLRLSGGDTVGHVVRYLAIAIILGIVLISMGVILNIIGRLRAGDYEGGLLGGFGLVGIVFYWGALAMGLKVIVFGSRPHDAWLTVLLVVLPLTVLTLHEPIYALLTRRARLWHESPLLGFFEGLIEALETVMAYLANTFSFLRVAAFALSHAALCLTIFVLQGAVEDLPIGALLSAVVFVIGTAVIIGLEGLIVTIQIFRLEYYEFFTKFFRGGGKEFTPFRLDGAGQQGRASSQRG